jgi:hypothetical protein
VLAVAQNSGCMQFCTTMRHTMRQCEVGKGVLGKMRIGLLQYRNEKKKYGKRKKKKSKMQSLMG